MNTPPLNENHSAPSPQRALEGLRVLDFSHALAGPYCTLLLAGYGADVYKLESPQGGELGRGWGPPFAAGESSFFLGLNRGKKGISIDLKRPEGIDLCLRLVERMDVVIENFRPGTMDRLGLGYDTVRTRNPRLIYCSISGYGQHGPSSGETALDLVVECTTGFLSITGTESGEQVRSGYAVADINAALFAIIGVLIAVQHRERTGRGQFVDVSMFDSMISAMTSNYSAYLGSGRVPHPLGTGFPTIVPYRAFQASDRVFSIAVASQKLWADFCQAINRPELQSHADYASNALRVRNRHALEGTLQDLFRTRTAREWVEILGSAGIPCGLVNNFAEVVEHPHAEFRHMFPWLEHPTVGKYRATGLPVKLSETPGQLTTSAPLLGQDTVEALTKLLGLDCGAIDHLLADGIIPAPRPLERSSTRKRIARDAEAQ